jgi:hypothetical protein
VSNYKPLADIARKRLHEQRSGFTKPIRGAGKFAAGWHSATIAAVDTVRLSDKGYMVLTLEDGDIHHKQTVFLCNYTKDDYSHEFRSVFNALFGDTTGLYEELLVEHQEEALHMLRGLKLDIEIQPGPGYIIDKEPGGYCAYDVVSSEALVPLYTSATEARRAVEARGHKRSYNRITNATPTYAETNSQSLRNAAEAISRAAKTVYTHAADSKRPDGDSDPR